MSKILGKIFGNAAGGVVEKLAGVADKFITTGDEKRKFQKEMETIFIDAEAKMEENVTRRWEADLQHGNWLTRSIRPLVLLFVICFTCFSIAADAGFVGFDLKSSHTDLLQVLTITCVASYFGGRSYEKSKNLYDKK